MLCNNLKKQFSEVVSKGIFHRQVAKTLKEIVFISNTLASLRLCGKGKKYFFYNSLIISLSLEIFKTLNSNNSRAKIYYQPDF
jgi:hypothetical protein